MKQLNVFASEIQYCAHLAPIFKALPEGLAEFFIDPRKGANTYAESIGLEHTLGRHFDAKSNLPVLVASYYDERTAAPRDIALVEHGAGQSYGPWPTTMQTTDRECVKLFLSPSESVAATGQLVYPNARIAVVGCPRLDPWHVEPKAMSGRPVVAFAWHWQADRWPESKSAWMHYRDKLPKVIEQLHNAGCDVIGHGHPRVMHVVRPWYERWGIPVVERSEDVFDLADIIACDNSSIMWEMASIGRPVVFLNAPWYRRTIHHGLRFWDMADIGPECWRADQIADAVAMCVNDREAWLRRIDEKIGRLYARRDGTATQAAVIAITEWLDARRESGIANMDAVSPSR